MDSMGFLFAGAHCCVRFSCGSELPGTCRLVLLRELRLLEEKRAHCRFDWKHGTQLWSDVQVGSDDAGGPTLSLGEPACETLA